MKLFARPALLALFLGSKEVLTTTYKLSDSFAGESFLSGFHHEAISDPTHGRVDYVNQQTAQRLNLTYAHGNTLILRADDKTKLSSSGAGRKSVRIASNKKWTNSVTVLDVRHMPVGCGTWPAFWTVGDDWPNQGEIDIIEGVNDQGPNLVSLHTSDGCMQPQQRSETGTPTSLDCQGNSGCSVRDTKSNSYGPGLNAVGGGWYAMERTSSQIIVWHWARNESPPADVRNGTSAVNTAAWGTPVARFVNNQCDVKSKFGPHQIVINLTFCGDWAGAVYGQSGCPSNCVDYVDNNPSAFKNAYWDIASVRVYLS
ncbi:glycoside hydrolase family 16 protein [Botryobasidium botryosum FD-172 SS1]|uniref:Glycoside hydrolase family 16 protein n=1 Tax=Botryobasidium botryosum (strain FD-172 SS1) TaxID=930990 RepID=A0A067LVY8_BOTB1|nr:glycoside hydrolase family 16 protein [Botryobasidium botryosum FD-172 SS1]